MKNLLFVRDDDGVETIEQGYLFNMLKAAFGIVLYGFAILGIVIGALIYYL